MIRIAILLYERMYNYTFNKIPLISYLITAFVLHGSLITLAPMFVRAIMTVQVSVTLPPDWYTALIIAAEIIGWAGAFS